MAIPALSLLRSNSAISYIYIYIYIIIIIIICVVRWVLRQGGCMDFQSILARGILLLYQRQATVASNHLGF